MEQLKVKLKRTLLRRFVFIELVVSLVPTAVLNLIIVIFMVQSDKLNFFTIMAIACYAPGIAFSYGMLRWSLNRALKAMVPGNEAEAIRIISLIPRFTSLMQIIRWALIFNGTFYLTVQLSGVEIQGVIIAMLMAVATGLVCNNLVYFYYEGHYSQGK